VRFYVTSAAAAAAGLRACKRCRPDSLPGSRDWDHRSDLVARAVRLIASGAADDSGVGAVAAQLGVSDRHLRRQLESELGASPGQLARTRRAQTARMLLEQTRFPVTDIAFAAGFRSLRQFNDVMRSEFGSPPTLLRRSPGGPAERTSMQPAEITLRLRMREPYDRAGVLSWLRRHAVPGVDVVAPESPWLRTTALDGTVITTHFGVGAVTARLRGADGLSWLPGRVASIRQWLDLDANPQAVTDVLGAVPRLHPLVCAHPGVRVVGGPDPFRALVCAILAQQVSVAAAATHAGRLVAAYDPAVEGFGGRFPEPAELAAADPAVLARQLGIPAARARTLVDAAAAVADGVVSVSPAADRNETAAALQRIRGIGPWTVADVRMRALADPDVWPASDLVLGRETASGVVAGLDPARAAPWRSYAAHQIWVAIAAAKADVRARKRTPRGGARAAPGERREVPAQAATA
jgi:AraC family transcriptional regulator of adaptative response / DNA-3-methyladenine glycosylase II